ncbi:MAG: 2-oxoacid:acceptor oxidoreductase family protein, partial [Calditrichia bacterium]
MSSDIAGKDKIEARKEKKVTKVKEHIVEIVSDSGEGAQKCGQSFGAISAKMGNGIWTVEIIPAEIQPPPRQAAGASGIRIRIGSFYITNAGNESDLVIAFNEQVLLGRVRSGNLKKGCKILLENMWRNHADPAFASAYRTTYDQLLEEGYEIYEIPMEEECLKYVSNPRRGKNMFALGVLCSVYNRDLDIAREQIRFTFQKKGDKVVADNIQLFDAGYHW